MRRAGLGEVLGLFFCLVLALNASCQTGTTLDSQTSLRETHDALFETYFPIHRFDSDPTTKQVLLQERSAAWQAFSSNPDIFPSLGALNDRTTLGVRFQMTSVSAFVKKNGKKHFQDLSLYERESLLALLHKSPSNQVRGMTTLLRNAYLSAAYRSDEVKEAVTGVKMPALIQPRLDDFLRTNTPVLPKSNYVYHASSKQLSLPPRHIDYLIVGSGPAGSVLGRELQKAGASVVVLERGPFVVPGALETRSFAQLQDASGQRASSDGGIYFRNGNAVGGGTTVNVDLAFAPTLEAIRKHIEQWRADGRISRDEFSSDEVSEAYGWVKQEVGTRPVGEGEVNANNQVLWDGASALGLHPKRYDLNTYAPGKSPSAVTDKRSALSQFLLPSMMDSANPLVMLPDTEVQRVIYESDGHSLRAVGVEARALLGWNQPGVIHDPNHLDIPIGETFSVLANRIILSAGALGSATILLRSKLPNPQVGAGVVIHPSMPIIGVFRKPTHILEGTTASVYVDDFLVSKGLAFEAMSADPGYAALMIVGSPEESFDLTAEYSQLAGFGVMAVDLPEKSNRVVLDSAGSPEIEYELGGETKDRLRFGIAEAVKIMFKAGAEKVCIPSNEDIFDSATAHLHAVCFRTVGELRALSRLQFIPGRTILTSAHMQATNKMGSGPDDSVVSKDFEVWGTTNLYVMDSSIFPTSIGANPMQSIYTFAKIFADRLVRERSPH